MNTNTDLVPMHIVPERRFDTTDRQYPERPPLNPAMGYHDRATFSAHDVNFESLIQDAPMVKLLRRYNSVINDANVAAATDATKLACVAWALRSINQIPEMQYLHGLASYTHDLLPNHYAHTSVYRDRSQDSSLRKFISCYLAGIKFKDSDLETPPETIRALDFRLRRLTTMRDCNEAEIAGTDRCEFKPRNSIDIAEFVQLPYHQAQVVADIGDPQYPGSYQHIWRDDDSDDQRLYYPSVRKPRRFETGMKPVAIEEVTPETERRDALAEEEMHRQRAAIREAKQAKKEAYAARMRADAERIKREAQEAEASWQRPNQRQFHGADSSQGNGVELTAPRTPQRTMNESLVQEAADKKLAETLQRQENEQMYKDRSSRQQNRSTTSVDSSSSAATRSEETKDYLKRAVIINRTKITHPEREAAQLNIDAMNAANVAVSDCLRDAIIIDRQPLRHPEHLNSTSTSRAEFEGKQHPGKRRWFDKACDVPAELLKKLKALTVPKEPETESQSSVGNGNRPNIQNVDEAANALSGLILEKQPVNWN